MYYNINGIPKSHLNITIGIFHNDETNLTSHKWAIILLLILITHFAIFIDICKLMC